MFSSSSGIVCVFASNCDLRAPISQFFIRHDPIGFSAFLRFLATYCSYCEVNIVRIFLALLLFFLFFMYYLLQRL